MRKTTAMLGSIILANALFAASLCAAPQSERRVPSDADRAPLQMEVVVRPPDVVAFRVRLDDDDDADGWVAILISDTERARPVDAARAPRVLDTDRAPRVLDTDTVLAYGRAVAGRYDAVFAYPISDRTPRTHEFYVQPVTVDRDGTIRVGVITHVESHGAAQPLDLDGDGHLDRDATGGAILDRSSSSYDGPPMDAWFIDGRRIGVEFTVPSNDYALYWDFNRPSEVGIDVFLFLEEPGEGEGLLDVVEFHDMTIPVSRDSGNLIRVFVARARRTSIDRSAATREYELAKVLRRP